MKSINGLLKARQHPKDEVQMSNKHVKRFNITSHWGKETETKLRFHIIQSEIQTVKRIKPNISFVRT